jgi:endo-1,4-beta-xylanase
MTKKLPPVEFGVVGLALAAGLAGCAAEEYNASAQTAPPLKDAFKNCFLIGVALNTPQVSGLGGCAEAIIPAQFNSISPENALKWDAVHPETNRYNFEPADRFVEYGVQHGMFVIGHTLVWQHQTPRWVFKDDGTNSLDRDALLQRMHDHIATVVGRYKGKIKGWDVVNEALDDHGTLGRSPWMRIIGEDYLLKAFEYAHEADPDAELYYNDFSLENASKRKGAIALLKKLRSQGAHIAGVGLQGHYKMDWPSPALLDETIKEFADAGLKVMITEMDLDVLPPATMSRSADISLNFQQQAKLNPYTNGLPADVEQKLAQRYADLFAVFVKHHDVVSRVTFWGVTDGDSWLNNWPVKGRTAYPLLFDRNCQPKPALDAVLRIAQ